MAQSLEDDRCNTVLLMTRTLSLPPVISPTPHQQLSIKNHRPSEGRWFFYGL